MKTPNTESLVKIYGESEKSAERFASLAQNFTKIFEKEDMEFFTAPGRTEIIGNHTDHNGGMILAGSITLDTIAAAAPNGTSVIRIVSEGYEGQITVDTQKLDKETTGTVALVSGMVEGAGKFGYKVSGFDAYVSTNVIAAAGVSSSASFEMLICSIMNYFFNESRMEYSDYARIGQYAENVYWKKASGLMDQMACAVGGTILLDFSDVNKIQYRKVDFTFDKAGYDLVIVNTGKGHADLSQDYSDVPNEMKAVAAKLGVNWLADTTLENLLVHVNEMDNDRAVLRAMHFFEENRRVKEAAAAVEAKDYEKVLRLLEQSGDSSWKWLQNCYTVQDCSEQKITLTLALTRLFLDKIGAGICRVHGGGFAGVIMCVVPKDRTQDYVSYIAQYVGNDNVYPMNVRDTGAVHID